MSLTQYGIAHLGLLPLRSEPSDRSELCTQLLFGETYQVLEESENRKWLYIRNDFDQYEGWLDKTQYYAISQGQHEACLAQDIMLSADFPGILQRNGGQLLLSPGSPLPPDSLNLGNYSGHSIPASPHWDKAVAQAIALKYRYTPYLWGGKGLMGIDCSGFTQQVYRLAGVALRRDAYQQAEQGKAQSLANAQGGDLAFFAREGRIVHVGILLDRKRVPALAEQLVDGEYLIIHALEGVRIDKLDARGIFNLDQSYYSHSLSHIRTF